MADVPLSIIILCHRNDQRLVTCLNSCQFAQEIVVIDFESGVNWGEWQKKIPINVIPRSGRIQDFAQARQAGLAAAQNDWVLFVDSDEALEADADLKISQLLSDPKINGWWLKRRDFFYGQALKYGEVGQVWLLRLARKRNASITRPVHEVVAVTGKTSYSTLTISHFAHTHLNEFLQKIIAYARLEAQFRDRYSLLRFWLEICVYPLGKFGFNYILKLGFRDGWRGFIYAFMMSLHSLLVRIFAYEKMVS